MAREFLLKVVIVELGVDLDGARKIQPLHSHGVPSHQH